MKQLRALTMAFAMTAAALTGLVVTQPTPASAAGVTEIRLQAPLAGDINGVTAKGRATYRNRGSSASFVAQIEDVNAADGTQLDVFVSHNGIETLAGKITVTLRRGELDLNTNDAQIVPLVAQGDLIVVKFNGATKMVGVMN
jgi:hypothetical protein